MQQEALFRKLSEAIFLVQKQKNKPLRIAINGVEGTGKTTFVSEFCAYLQKKRFGGDSCPYRRFSLQQKT